MAEIRGFFYSRKAAGRDRPLGRPGADAGLSKVETFTGGNLHSALGTRVDTKSRFRMETKWVPI